MTARGEWWRGVIWSGDLGGGRVLLGVGDPASEDAHGAIFYPDGIIGDGPEWILSCEETRGDEAGAVAFLVAQLARKAA